MAASHSKVQEIAENRLAYLVMRPAVGPVAVLKRCVRAVLLRGGRRRPLDDLVEFAAVQPYAAAFRAAIDFDSESMMDVSTLKEMLGNNF